MQSISSEMKSIPIEISTSTPLQDTSKCKHMDFVTNIRVP